MRGFLSFITFSLFIFSLSAHAQKPYLMVAMGDSITAGTLADTALENPKSGSAYRKQILAKRSGVSTRSASWFSNKSLSWSTGAKIKSQFTHFSQYIKDFSQTYSVAPLNISVPGSRAVDMPDQADELLDELSTGNYEGVKYITMLIGANDACSSAAFGGTPIADMKKYLMSALKKLSTIQQAEPIRVLLPGMPNVPALGRKEIAEHETMGIFNCESIREDIMGACPGLLNWKNQKEYLALVDAVLEKNKLLKDVGIEAMKLYPNLDIAYSDAVFNYNIVASDLAVDCFHPNHRAQATIAEILWKDLPAWW